MARNKKDPAQEAAPAPVQEAQEQTTPLQEQEAHLDPGQLESMDDANLQGLAQDMGLDPAAYEDRASLIAAIAAVPVTPGPPEAEADPEDPAQEPDPEPDPAGERHTPYKATVAVSLAVVHKEVGLGTADMLKPVGTLKQGAAVTVTGRKGTYAQLKNGLYILEALLEIAPTT